MRRPGLSEEKIIPGTALEKEDQKRERAVDYFMRTRSSIFFTAALSHSIVEFKFFNELKKCQHILQQFSKENCIVASWRSVPAMFSLILHC